MSLGRTDTRAVLQYLSLEPLLGDIRLRWPKSHKVHGRFFSEGESLKIDWVIIGAESGPGRRWCDPNWVMSIIQQCHAASVPVFMKQIHEANGRRLPRVIKDPNLIANDLGYAPQELRQWPVQSGRAVPGPTILGSG